jgi:DNA-binding winged helix-turn-helix (wHTH) protein/Tfp pilus assembly protein PilF
MPSPTHARGTLRFGDFELDVDGQELRHSGVPCRLQPQPLKVLVLLITAKGRIVTREQLERELWGEDTFVDFDQGLNYCIRQIRTVLGDEPQSPRYIETIPRRGYRFIAKVSGLEEATSEPSSHPSQDPARKDYPRKKASRKLVMLLSVLGLAVVLTVTIIATGAFKRPPLTEKDYLLVTEFSNQTGDAVFDDTLRKAVSIDLGQSPFLNIVPDEKIRQTLSLMGKAKETRLTAEIGREICQRNGYKAMLTGSLASLGNQYSLALEVINISSGEIVAEERVQAANKEQVLSVLGQANDRLRKKLGESLTSIQQFGKPLQQATTPSLEALQLFTIAEEKRGESELASIPFFEKAIQIDPDFALAHAVLGTVYLNVEQLRLAEEHEKKAVALSERVSEREKLYITAHYYLLIGQRDQVIQTYETYRRLYPRDPLPEEDLANEFSILGRYDKALEHALTGIRLTPDDAGARAEVARAYSGLGRLEEAKQTVVDGLKLSPDSTWLHMLLSNIALAQGDAALRDREDAALKATPSGNLDLLYRDAALAASRGRLRQSQELYAQAAQLALKLGLKENASFAMGLRAVHEAYLQNPAEAKRSAYAALKLSQMSDTIEPVAVALAVSGDSKHAETLIDDLTKRRPEDTSIEFQYAPMVHAMTRLHQDDPRGAILIMAPGVSYDRGNVDSMLVRANAFLQAKRSADAIEEFRRIVSLRTVYPSDPGCAVAQLGLARAYAQAGDKPSSLAAYQEFLTLWKDADRDLPALTQAEAEFAALRK